MLMVAAEKGHAEVFQALMDKEADVNAVNKLGDTSLGLAEKANKESVVDMLRNFTPFPEDPEQPGDPGALSDWVI